MSDFEKINDKEKIQPCIVSGDQKWEAPDSWDSERSSTY